MHSSANRLDTLIQTYILFDLRVIWMGFQRENNISWKPKKKPLFFMEILVYNKS